MEQIKQKFTVLVGLMKDINEASLKFNNIIFFANPSLTISFSSYETCFKDTVFYLYSLFIELPGPNLKFVNSKIRDFGFQHSDVGGSINKVVQNLRTVRGHYTTLEKPKDKEKINFCEDWYLVVANKNELSTEEDFNKCANALFDGTNEFLSVILNCLKYFSEVEHSEIIKETWEREVNRNFTKYNWEVELTEVLELYGMNFFDAQEIVEKQYSKWSTQLKLLNDDFIFKDQAKRIIGKFLEEESLCPVTATDLHELGIPKGKLLGVAVKNAKALFYESPCSKADLLSRYKAKYPISL